MKSGRHFEQHDLIDFVERDLTEELAGEIRDHIKTCVTCRAYVESLGRTFAALREDSVPEQSPGYWDYFEQRVRERAKPVAGTAHEPVPVQKPVPGRSLALYWFSGLAAAAALVLLLWWLPKPMMPGQVLPESGMSQVDPVDVLLADLSTGEIIESLSGNPAISLLLIEADAEEIEEIEEYLAETTEIDDLVDQLTESEMENFILNLRDNMKEEDNTSGIRNGSARKGC